MKVYTFSQARQNLAEVLNQSKDERVLIRRRGGETFMVVPKPREGSPFDGPGVKTKATTKDILNAVRESRFKSFQQRRSGY
jgi:prevent-host-death family protein